MQKFGSLKTSKIEKFFMKDNDKEEAWITTSGEKVIRSKEMDLTWFYRNLKDSKRVYKQLIPLSLKIKWEND